MGSIYKEYFYVPENGKCREKVVITRVITSVLVILACLFAMSFTAYAYFTAPPVPVPADNFIGAAKYELDIQVTSGGTPVVLSEENTFMADAGKEYVISLEYVDGSATTGFCGVKIDKKIYHTQQIGADLEAENEFRQSTEFTIAIEGTGSIPVELIPHWGTSSFYDTFSVTIDEISEEAEEELAEETEKKTEEKTEEKTKEEIEREEKLAAAQSEMYIVEGEVITLEIVDGVIPEVYVVQVGDTLWEIAKLYETTVEKLAAFNGITNKGVVTVGQELKIPPEGWVIPKEQTKSEPTTQTPPVTEQTPPTTTSPTPATTEVPEEKTEPEATPELEAKPEETTPAEETNS